MRILLVTALVSTILGCAGSDFRWEEARKVKQGMTTAEVAKLLGPPTNVTTRNGTVIYVWAHINGLSGISRTIRVDFIDDKVVQAPAIPDSFTD